MSGDVLQVFNDLPDDAARDVLSDFCGATGWVEGMLARRPFASEAAMLDAADAVWRALAPDEWLASFHHHPRIGESRSHARQSAAAQAMSAREQGAVARASRELRATLVDANATYEERFGYIFIICAHGLRTEEMLASLALRLGNDPDDELGVAAEEQRKITRLRLARFLEVPA